MSETVVPSVAPRRFGNLRGVQWRIDLGILPSSLSASIDDLRRVTADSRRRYAALRRQLLVDPQVAKDGTNSLDLVMDNPLSQSADSMWGRFFKNAELERMVDQDLTRLYPERGSYFQTSVCQGILRRILLLWCLRNPEYGYRQGMHELLAPLLYVLHVDLERFFAVRKVYDDQFTDKFDGFSFHENDLTYKFDFKKISASKENESGIENNSLCELAPEIQNIVLLTDAYGAEGELGIVLSEKFLEHDAYSMFDSLLSGNSGAIVMSEFFSSPFHKGVLPVIEASTALFHLLSVVDSSLHSHLVEIEVQPQYFALRWLRVLFGREFSLEELLLIWDEIFARENTNSNKATKYDEESNFFMILNSPRGAFISAFAVSMILNLRSSLLSTENATSCLQRLLNFPHEVNLPKLIAKAASLQDLALGVNANLPIYPLARSGSNSLSARGHSLSLGSNSPSTLLHIVPDSYWEEKWRGLHEEEAEKKSVEVPNRVNGWSDRVTLRLSRTESDPSPAPSKKNSRTAIPKRSVRRNLLNDLARQLGSDEDKDNTECDEDICHQDPVEADDPGLSDPTSPTCENQLLDNESEISVASNQPLCEDNAESNHDDSCQIIFPNDDSLTSKVKQHDDSRGKLLTGMKEKLMSSKFQWLWKLGRNAGDGTSQCSQEDVKALSATIDQNIVATICTEDSSSGKNKGEAVEQNVMVSLRNLGQSMLDNIQVIESVFQQDRVQVGLPDNLSKNGFVGKGQVTAMSALKELRKISNLLSEV